MYAKIFDTLLKKNLVVITESDNLHLLYGAIHRVAQVEQVVANDVLASRQTPQTPPMLILICTEADPKSACAKLPSSFQPSCTIVDCFSDPLGWNSGCDSRSVCSLKNGLFKIVKTALDNRNNQGDRVSESSRCLIICDSLTAFLQLDGAQLYRDLCKLSSLKCGVVSLLANVDVNTHLQAAILELEKQCNAVMRVTSLTEDDCPLEKRVEQPEHSNSNIQQTIYRYFSCEIVHRSSLRRPTKRSTVQIGVQIIIDPCSSDESAQLKTSDYRQCRFKLVEVHKKREAPSLNLVSKTDSAGSVRITSAVKAVDSQPSKKDSELEELSSSERAARSRVRLPFEFSEAEKRATLERERRLRDGEAVSLHSDVGDGDITNDPDSDLYR